MPANMAVTAALIREIYVRFEAFNDATAKSVERFEQSGNFRCQGRPGKAVGKRVELKLQLRPVARDTLAKRRLDQLCDVASAKGYLLLQLFCQLPCGDGLCGQTLDFVGAGK